ncbi:MAG: sensor histidine kinase [Anaerolineae bacterium]|nr:sensor histidine kinase [Anaerolineae bacterium]
MKRLTLTGVTAARSDWRAAGQLGGPRLVWTAWLAIAALTIGLTLAGLPARFHELMANTGQPILSPLIISSAILGMNIVLAGLFIAAALWIVRLKGRAPVALFLSLTLLAIGATETGITGALVNPEHGVNSALLRWLVLSLGAVTLAGAMLLLYAFPDGHFVPAWSKWPALMWVVLMAIWLVVPQAPFNPLNGPTWRATPLPSLLVGVVWFGSGLMAQTYRYRRVSGLVERQQAKWTVLGLAGALAGGVLYYGLLALAQDGRWSGDQAFLTYLLVRPALQTAFMALLPICLAIAIMRYHLFDIDLILNRTLVYGALTLAVIAIYVAVVGTLGAIFTNLHSLLISLIATGLVAVAFNPLREHLQRGANRLIYGERDDPYAVLSRLGRRLSITATPEATLDTVVDTIAQALKLPHAAIALQETDGLTVVARYPDQLGGRLDDVNDAGLTVLPLTYQGEQVGQLLLAQRSPDAPFSVADQRLLDDVARQVGIVAQSVRLQRDLQHLATDLQHARERLVTTREEERRRLRRDLHDGLGPSLASLTFKLDTARDLMARDPGRADLLLSNAAEQLQATVADIRQLVYNLRPPALDELGLAAALYESAQQICGALQVDVELPAMPVLPAAMEVAAYRIAQEAMANVVRHADARCCSLRLWLDDQALNLEVRDDGHGWQGEARGGVGLHAMQERAAELGGVCSVDTCATGTVVRAWFPLVYGQERAIDD